MNIPRSILLAALILVANVPAQDPPGSSAVIRTESRVVLVDAVVTDKKGNYVRDLKQKDFRVWEDNKEQAINSFTFESDAASPANDRKHYLVLFFDNSTSGPADQRRARDAAVKFIDTNAAKNHLMAIAEFSGGLQIAQNFTEDTDRLKQVVNGVKFSSLSPNSGPAALRNFSTRSVLLALRDLAKGLANVPGRKSLIFISGGFPLDTEGYQELTATIDACNRANVAVYPIDVRGLVAPGMSPASAPGRRGALELPGYSDPASPATSAPKAAVLSAGFVRGANFQTKGGGAKGSGGSTGSTGSTGSSGTSSSGGGGGAAGTSSRSNAAPRVNPAPAIIPPMNTGIAGMQQVLYALASGTGGFVIVNSNDLFAGLEKIGKEQNEYYLLGYTPSKELEPGACHTIKVKVDQGDTVRARSGYCDVKPKDILAGTPTERDLEARATGNAPPTVKSSMLAPFLFTAPGTARVDMTMDIPSDALVFNKEKGKFRMSLNIVGIVYLPDGGVAARFSDVVKREFEDKKLVEEFQQRPLRYEKQFEVASGKYTFKVVFSAGGGKFGKMELPLAVDPYENNQFLVSGLVLSKQARNTNSGSVNTDAILLEDLVPLVVNNIQLVPSSTNHFSKTDKGYVYGEIYEPAFAAQEIKDPPAVGLQMQVFETKTNAIKIDSGLVRLDPKPQPGVPTIPFGLKIDVASLAAGSYQVRITGLDAAGRKFTRATDIEIDQ